MEFKNTLKGISKDFILNIVASLVSTGTMQLVLYPALAKHLNAQDYGQMLTIMGVVNVLILAFGNNLCNARIVQNNKYKNANIVGDFQILLVIVSLISAIITLVLNFYFRLNSILLLGLVATTCLSVAKSYYSVAYRINIDYMKNLVMNIILATFYIISIPILFCSDLWSWIFFIPCIPAIFYINKTSSIVNEPFSKTLLFNDSFKVVVLLVLSGIIGNITGYVDRFVVYPLIGGRAVSTFTTASFFSKSVSLILAPITSVVLSYLIAGRIQMTTQKFKLINFFLIVASIIFFLFSVTVGKYITGLLYPTLIKDADEYIYLASLGVIIGIAGVFSGVIVLACAPSYWQVVLELVNLVFTLLTGYLLVNTYGLWGMCYAIILTNSISFALKWIVGYYYLNNKN